jgi:hypothetical protein
MTVAMDTKRTDGPRRGLEPSVGTGGDAPSQAPPERDVVFAVEPVGRDQTVA